MTRKSKPPTTLVLLAFNQEKYIAEALHGVLNQDYPDLQIIVSDDCSGDATFKIIEEAVARYEGPHSVLINRNLSNMGLASHINALIPMINTRFLVLAAGDDISVPNRTSRLVDKWIAGGSKTSLIYSNMIGIDDCSLEVEMRGESVYKGPHSVLNMARGDVHVLGATTAMTKDLFDRFPGLSSTVVHEDRVLPFRALLLGGSVAYVDEPLVKYRVTGGLSRQSVKTLRDYLDVYTPSIAIRTLPDAVQRLADILIAQPDNRSIRYECEATVADHESRLDMHLGKSWCYEVIVFRWLFRGARKKSLFIHYLKMRFLRVFN